MDTITDIREQKKRDRRRSIYVNGEFFAGVDEEVVARLGLRIGQEADAERLAAMLAAEETRRARESALNLLDYRPRSRREIETRLRRKGCSDESIAQVTDRLSEAGLLDDERFAAQWVESRMRSRPTGKTRLAWELRGKGVSQETVEQALQEIGDDDELRMAREVAGKTLGGSCRIDETLKRRIAGVLRRRGFRWDTVSRVLSELGADD